MDIIATNRPRAASPTLRLADDASSLATRLESRTERRETGRHFEVFPAGAGLAIDERGQIERALRDLDRLQRETCSPERCEVVEWAAEMLTSNFKARRKFHKEEDQRADDDRVFDGFLMALDGRPSAAVTEAVRRIIADETELSRIYVPTATELAGVVRAVVDRWTADRGRLERLLTIVEEAPAEPQREMTEAEREDLRQRVARITGKGRAVGRRRSSKVLRKAKIIRNGKDAR